MSKNLASLLADKKAKQQEAQRIVDTAKAAVRTMTQDEQDHVGQILDQIHAIDEQIEAKGAHDALVERLQESSAPSDADTKTADAVQTGGVAERFVKSAALLDFRAKHGSVLGEDTPINVKAGNLGTLADLGVGTKADGATITTATSPPTPTRLPGYQNNLLTPDLSFLDLITTGTTAASYLQYAQIIAETDNSAVVAEGELKPTSDITTGLADAKAYVYADGFTITNQELADDGALASILQARVGLHVRNRIIEKLFSGTGTATDPRGIMNTSGVQQQAWNPAGLPETIGDAINKVETNAEVEVQAIVMHPNDVWKARYLKDADGRYLFGGPGARGPLTFWDVPVVKSRRMTEGQALAGNFSSVTFLEREPLSIVAFNQHKDYAQRNLVYVRAELRGLQLFRSPRDVVVVDLTA